MDLKSEFSEAQGLKALHFNGKDDLKGQFLPVCIEYCEVASTTHNEMLYNVYTHCENIQECFVMFTNIMTIFKNVLQCSQTS